jgi:hypothetical protein
MADLPEATVKKPDEKDEAAFAAPPEEQEPTKKTRKPRQKREKIFFVASAEGNSVCEESQLPEALDGRTEVEVFLIEKKVKSIKVISGEEDLLSGMKAPAKIEIKYE